VQLVRYCHRDFILDGEDIVEGLVIFLRPEVCIGARIDKLCRDTNIVAGLAHRAFKDVRYVELAVYVGHVDILALEGPRCRTRDDPQLFYARQLVEQLLGHSIREEFLLGVGTHIQERHHEDRPIAKLVEERAGQGALCRLLGRLGYIGFITRRVEDEFVDGEIRDREYQHGRDNPIEHAGVRSRRSRRSIFVPSYALGRPLEFPGENQRRNKSDRENDYRRAKDDGWQKVRRQCLNDLDQQPGAGKVSESDPVNITLAKIVKHSAKTG
jgi:hypothetical protein